MEELKHQLKLLNAKLILKQEEIINIKELINQTTKELQNQCQHQQVNKSYHFDGHKSNYTYICHDCQKHL